MIQPYIAFLCLLLELANPSFALSVQLFVFGQSPLELSHLVLELLVVAILSQELCTIEIL